MRRPLARLWIMVWAVKSLSPELRPHPEERAPRAPRRMAQPSSFETRVAPAPQDEGGSYDLCSRSAHFIGQIASATAAWGGKMVTNLPPVYCSSTGSASLFWPISSNLTRFQGMMVVSPGMSVATSASRILSPSVDLARLMASAITIRPMNWRDEKSLRSLPDFSLNMSLILPTIGRLAARSSEKEPREMTPGILSPTASYSAFSEKPASCATIALAL